MHFSYKSSWFALSCLVSWSCSNPCKTGTTIDRCIQNVYFQFSPPVTARNEISVTVSAGDANYTATYPAIPDTRSDVSLQVASYGGAYSMSVATLSYMTPAIVNYSVIADGSVVATGTVSPSYRQVNKGGSECPDYCPEATVNVPVTQ